MKIFHGISGAAGQPSMISRAQRDLGFDANCFGLDGNKFGFSVDSIIGVDGDFNASLFNLLHDDLLDYDVFHFYFRSLFYTKNTLAYPTAVDLLLLKALGKTVIVNFRGSEARLHSQFKKFSPYNYVDENPDGLVSSFPEEAQRRYIELAISIADEVLVPDVELASYVPGSTIVPRAMDLSKFKVVDPAPKNDAVVRIVHAPSRRVVKGTSHIIGAVEQLQREGLNVELVLVEGMKNDEALSIYASADIIVDQLRIGWYGVLAVEGMALKRCVVSYIRDDLLPTFQGSCPVYCANPDNILDSLRCLVEDASLRDQIAEQGYNYCISTHDSTLIAKKLIEVYKRCSAGGRPHSSLEQSRSLVKFFYDQYLLNQKVIGKLNKALVKVRKNEQHLESLLARQKASRFRINKLRKLPKYIKAKIALASQWFS